LGRGTRTIVKPGPRTRVGSGDDQLPEKETYSAPQGEIPFREKREPVLSLPREWGLGAEVELWEHVKKDNRKTSGAAKKRKPWEFPEGRGGGKSVTSAINAKNTTLQRKRTTDIAP